MFTSGLFEEMMRVLNRGLSATILAAAVYSTGYFYGIAAQGDAILRVFFSRRLEYDVAGAYTVAAILVVLNLILFEWTVKWYSRLLGFAAIVASIGAYGLVILRKFDVLSDAVSKNPLRDLLLSDIAIAMLLIVLLILQLAENWREMKVRTQHYPCELGDV